MEQEDESQIWFQSVFGGVDATGAALPVSDELDPELMAELNRVDDPLPAGQENEAQSATEAGDDQVIAPIQASAQDGVAYQHYDDVELPDADQISPPQSPLFEQQYPSDDFSDDEEVDPTLDLVDRLADEEYERARQHLRPRNHNSGVMVTWIDEDPTGDYDPDEERRLLNRLNRRRQSSARRPSGKRMVAEDASDEESSAEDNIVILSFDDAEPRRRYIRYAREHEALHSASAGLLSRSKRSRITRRCAAGTVDLDELASLAEQGAGKPWARGCIACLMSSDKASHPDQKSSRCSLLEDETSWPCQTCQDGDALCQLITDPMRKRACTHCKTRKISCSYLWSRNHDRPCENCAQHGLQCIAGPDKILTAPRLRYGDHPYTPPPPRAVPSAQAAACLECQLCGITCEPNEEEPYQPCPRCVELDESCINVELWPRNRNAAADDSTMDDASEGTTSDVESSTANSTARKVPSTTPAATKKRSSTAPIQPSTPPTPPRPVFSPPSVRLRTISTRFAHPIHLTFASSECDLCTNPQQALIGLPLVHPEVLDYKDNRGWVETFGGHRQVGTPASRICGECVERGVKVLECTGHVWGLIRRADVEDRKDGDGDAEAGEAEDTEEMQDDEVDADGDDSEKSEGEENDDNNDDDVDNEDQHHDGGEADDENMNDDNSETTNASGTHAQTSSGRNDGQSEDPLQVDGEWTEEVQRQVLDKVFGGKIEPLEMYCACCLRLADYACCAEAADEMEDDDDDDDDDDDNEPGSGCGLRLCARCMRRLSKPRKRQFGDLLLIMEAEERRRGPLGMRADAELIRPNGVLERYLRRQGQG